MPISANYSAFVAARFKKFPSDRETVMHAAIGISSEAGELLDVVKKNWAYGKPLDILHLIEEAGDTLFYLQALANILGTTLDAIARVNEEKLKKRYPSEYSDAQALARADKMVKK